MLFNEAFGQGSGNSARSPEQIEGSPCKPAWLTSIRQRGYVVPRTESRERIYCWLLAFVALWELKYWRSSWTKTSRHKISWSMSVSHYTTSLEQKIWTGNGWKLALQDGHDWSRKSVFNFVIGVNRKNMTSLWVSSELVLVKWLFKRKIDFLFVFSQT